MFGALFGQGVSKKKTVEVKRPAPNHSNGVVANGQTNGSIPRPKSTNAPSRTVKPTQKRKNDSPARLSAPKKSARQSRSQSVQTPLFGSDESDSEQVATKRRKVEEVDIERKVRRLDMYNDSKTIAIIHAADIPGLDKTTKFESLLDEFPENEELELQYPSRGQRERFRLIQAMHDRDGYQAHMDIVETMHQVASNYLPEEETRIFDDESTGYPQRLKRALKKKQPEKVRAVVEEYNSALSNLVKNGTIARILDEKHSLRPALIERIMNQVYSRTVSLNLKHLKAYEAASDNVYGELLPKFISSILKEDLKLRSDQIFVDLGSGVGNVVLQTALEVGCESWGCEMMPNYCRVADLQQAEFEARAQLWGLNMGQVRLEKGDFLQNSAIQTVLRKADAVLVNNQVFSPATNESLTRLFLDLKDGCKIVSLKSFVPADIKARNVNSINNVLKVEQKSYYSGCVSWKNDGGTYFISTKDSKLVEKFLRKRVASDERGSSE